ncbi:hypothetical protein GLOIN_2v1790208 [Rhizophagus clarus]|uniref:Uncharacterized protein n=1 Tax=Rhizophagus clarus TaxID=94130 RepID=A0A8H3R128_9GLOM|nr:hypothetical protein GLOIN_2v1790208 [Rhizophagus clarus]
MLRISTSVAREIMANLILRFVLVFKHHIWIPRCNLTVEWEKRNNISTQAKRASMRRSQYGYLDLCAIQTQNRPTPPAYASDSNGLPAHHRHDINQATFDSYTDCIVYDDPPLPVLTPPPLKHKTAAERKAAAVPLTWKAIDGFIKSFQVDSWLPTMRAKPRFKVFLQQVLV